MTQPSELFPCPFKPEFQIGDIVEVVPDYKYGEWVGVKMIVYQVTWSKRRNRIEYSTYEFNENDGGTDEWPEDDLVLVKRTPCSEGTRTEGTPAPADLEALKRELDDKFNQAENENYSRYFMEDLIDHLAATGRLNVKTSDAVTAHCGCGDPIPQEDLRCDTCQHVQYQVLPELVYDTAAIPFEVVEQVAKALGYYFDRFRDTRGSQIKASSAIAALAPYRRQIDE